MQPVDLIRRLAPSADPVDLAEDYAYPEQGRWLRANMVSSLDGAATRDDRSGGLGGAADRLVFSTLRGLADAIVVGAGTVRAEEYGPVRPGEGWDRLRAGRPAVPPLAIVSRGLALDFDAPVFTETGARTIVLTTESAAPARLRAARERADVIVAGRDRLDFGAAADALAERGHTRLLCEGGPGVLAQVAAAGLLDELCLTLSPLLVAGAGPRVLHGPAMAVAAELRLAHVLESESFLLLRYARGSR
ncbi:MULTISPECIES: pyrimidine reductase family protein [Thermomonosporaceae]|uniref:pyrimidine reductase family protein n=1 Tax=Thermomonosporaceae TaxID=2012 RepID=UPI00255A7CC6|nr:MULTISPECIES: pyrimidine reductase family protein [Thermomonosporaceae]MDL4774778.1 pyrimidine reductase family protein [Actinomadura xylanilytica]